MNFLNPVNYGSTIASDMKFIALMRIRVTKQSFNEPQKLFSFNGCCKWHADTKAFETLKKIIKCAFVTGTLFDNS